MLMQKAVMMTGQDLKFREFNKIAICIRSQEQCKRQVSIKTCEELYTGTPNNELRINSVLNARKTEQGQSGCKTRKRKVKKHTFLSILSIPLLYIRKHDIRQAEDRRSSVSSKNTWTTGQTRRSGAITHRTTARGQEEQAAAMTRKADT